MISSVMPWVCCLVTRVVTGLLNLLSMYLIHIAMVRSSSILCTLRICVAAGTLPASSRASAILVQYSMLRASAWFLLL